jgi:hypothetical protein
MEEKEKIKSYRGLCDLFEFIGEKSKLINNKIQEKSKEIINQTDENGNKNDRISIMEAALTYGELNGLKVELDVLRDISRVLHKLSSRGTAHPDKKILGAFLQEEIRKKSEFNSSHPLCGYKPYHEMLITHFKNQEDYEKCAQIQKVIETKQKYLRYS